MNAPAIAPPEAFGILIRIFTEMNAPALPEASGILIRIFTKTNAPLFRRCSVYRYGYSV